ncbi:auxin-induced protein 6B-like [Pyrus ussuriensis x Pyrus communis]|uniref:Auxin-induced protein 6B-like n=1 Tax=Pyrus ussuriensis x Pyrus communis TaxID=2448454 RepID=A0A5N5HP23_9ROSA|nr:auxin-induced protein 6B-like [Pyrus ussuriensis x Pyrus communis]
MKLASTLQEKTSRFIKKLSKSQYSGKSYTALSKYQPPKKVGQNLEERSQEAGKAAYSREYGFVHASPMSSDGRIQMGMIIIWNKHEYIMTRSESEVDEFNHPEGLQDCRWFNYVLFSGLHNVNKVNNEFMGNSSIDTTAKNGVVILIAIFDALLSPLESWTPSWLRKCKRLAKQVQSPKVQQRWFQVAETCRGQEGHRPQTEAISSSFEVYLLDPTLQQSIKKSQPDVYDAKIDGPIEPACTTNTPSISLLKIFKE